MGSFRRAHIYIDQLLEDAARVKALVLMWLCFSPVLLIIPLTIRSLLHARALSDPAQQVVTHGSVLKTRRSRGNEVAQYEFNVNGKWYTSAGAIGRANPYSSADWQPVERAGPTIEVRYVRSDPSINVPNNGLNDDYVGNTLIGFLIGGLLSSGWIAMGREIRRMMTSDRLLRTRIRTE
jgi:hypothetical protein